MKKTTFSVMLILLLLAGLVLTMGASGDEPEGVPIIPWLDGQTYDIYPDQVGVLQAGWAACSPGLVRAWIGASNYELTLDGATILTPEDVDDLWGAVEIYESPPEFAEDCVGKGRPAHALWRQVLDSLGPGTYTLGCRIWIDHTLIDGADYDGDGAPDRFTPDGYYIVTGNTIIVHNE